MMLIIARSSFWPPFLPQTEFVVMEFWTQANCTRLANEGSTGWAEVQCSVWDEELKISKVQC